MRILKIRRFSPVPYRPATGYGGRAVEGPMSVLKQMGHEITAIAPVPFAPWIINRVRPTWQQYSDVPSEEELEGVQVYHPRFISFPDGILYSLSGPLMAWASWGMARRLNALHSFDIVHAHYGYPDGYLAARAARSFQIPFVLTIQAGDLDVTIHMSAHTRKRLRQVVEDATIIISPTEVLSRKLKAEFGKSSTLVHYGIDTKKLFTSVSPMADQYNNHLVIMSVCQLVVSKGLDLNLHAIAELVETHQDVKYLIVGDGPDRSRLESLVDALGIREHVEFVGTMSHDRVMEYLSICDIFSMPSWRETFGLVYVEAMAHGIPVIGCEGQGIASLIIRANAGYTVKPGNSQAVMEALKRMIENESMRKQMGANGRRFALENLSLENAAQGTLAVYEAALAKITSDSVD